MAKSNITGIDVSKWQKGFKLKNAINEGFTYIILRAGSADKGEPYKDPLFDTFYIQAKSLSFENIGAYFYGRAFSVNDAIKEANVFMSYISNTSIRKVYYDVEGKMLNQDKNTLTTIIKAFCDTLNAAGYICGIYSSEYYFNNGMNDKELAKYPHWIAKYSKNEPKLTSKNACEMWQYGGSTNLFRDPKIAGTVIDQNFIYIPWDIKVKTSEKEVKPVAPKDITYDTIHKLALEVLAGKHGSGEVRKQKLGSLYDSVQAEVNAIVEQRAAQTVEKTTEQLASEVLAGLWGNGAVRKMKLGKRYNEVQLAVAKMIEERNKTSFNYTVVKGDTLIKIAKKYNITVEQIMTLNDLENPNKIWVGQMLKLS